MSDYKKCDRCGVDVLQEDARTMGGFHTPDYSMRVGMAETDYAYHQRSFDLCAACARTVHAFIKSGPAK